jgi:clan AA aspartic protease, TIGR02281 family
VILTVALAVLAAALGLLIYNHGAGTTFSMPNDDFAQLSYLAILGSVIAASLVGSHRRMGEFVRNLLLWTVIVLGLVTGWTYRDELERVAADVVADLSPGRPVVLMSGETMQVSLRKAMNGHFEADAFVNGTPVSFLIDTGATTIALSYDDAIAAGFDPVSLSFTVPIMTANGAALAAPVRLDVVEIGPIRRVDLRATVAEKGKLEQSLLGMNFISSLSGFEMRRNEIILKD